MTISVLTSPAIGINRAPTYNLHGKDSHVITSEKSKIRAIVTNEINKSAVKRKNRVLFDISILEIFKSLQIIWVKCIPLSLRSKTRRRATPLLPTWIYSCRSRGDSQLGTSLYDKRDDFNFHNFITNFPFLSSNTLYFILASLWRFYLTAHTLCKGLLLLWMFYSKGGAAFI